MFKQLFFDESGQGMSEYGLILGLVAIASVTALSVGGKNIKNIFSGVSTVLQKADIDGANSLGELSSGSTSQYTSYPACNVSGDIMTDKECWGNNLFHMNSEYWDCVESGDEEGAAYWYQQQQDIVNTCNSTYGTGPCHTYAIEIGY